MVVTESLSGLAALAMTGFMIAFIALMLFMVLVQPLWCVVDCAVDAKRSTLGKVLWVVALIALYGLANWFYGAFAAAGPALRRLTRLAWALRDRAGALFCGDVCAASGVPPRHRAAVAAAPRNGRAGPGRHGNRARAGVPPCTLRTVSTCVQTPSRAQRRPCARRWPRRRWATTSTARTRRPTACSRSSPNCSGKMPRSGCRAGRWPTRSRCGF